MIISIITLLLLASFSLWFWKKGIYMLASHYAKGHMEKMLFNSNSEQKKQVIELMKTITKEKYKDEDLLDYFLKIKGLQVINFYDPVSFWTRKFLMSPTQLKLNYFEQVKFYETFLNYPASNVNNKADNNWQYHAESPKEVFIGKKQLA